MRRKRNTEMLLRAAAAAGAVAGVALGGVSAEELVAKMAAKKAETAAPKRKMQMDGKCKGASGCQSHLGKVNDDTGYRRRRVRPSVCPSVRPCFRAVF